MQQVVVTLHDYETEKPEHGTMILADTGSDWYILMYGEMCGVDGGYEWEGQYDPIEFVRWAYLGELNGKFEKGCER